MAAGHLAKFGLRSGSANDAGELPNRIGWKEPVGADADKAEPGANAAESPGRRGVAVQGVPGFHGAQDGQVGVGVEAFDEALSLVVEVAGDVETSADQAAAVVVQTPRVLAVAVGIAAEPFLEE